MAKKKGIYDDILFWNKDKKDVDNAEEVSDNTTMAETIKQSVEKRAFTPTLNAYVPYLNENTKKFELFVIKIDPISDEVELVREVLKHDSLSRATMEMQQRYAQDYVLKQRRGR